MSKYKYLLDPGHGGMIDGVYTTAPKKMYDHGDFVFYEGVFNRKLVARICEKLDAAGIEYKNLVPEQEDISLVERVRRANELHIAGESVIYVSVHANAGGGVGYEIFTSEGQTKSDKVSDCFFDAWEDVIPNQRQRSQVGPDGDRDKEARFYVLRKTACPAILTECGFMDNYKEAKWMMSEEGIEILAEAHVQGILNVEVRL